MTMPSVAVPLSRAGRRAFRERSEMEVFKKEYETFLHELAETQKQKSAPKYKAAAQVIVWFCLLAGLGVLIIIWRFALGI